MEKINANNGVLVRLSVDEATNICKLGQGEKCCAYIVMGPEGFECSKKELTLSSEIYGRLQLDIMKARGEGGWEGCPWKDEKL